jgi:hypothetical protein
MENRHKCSKILTKRKQLTSIALRTSAHFKGPEVRTTNLGIRGAHIGSEEVRSDQKRVGVSVAKKSFFEVDLRRRGDVSLELGARSLETSDFDLSRGIRETFLPWSGLGKSR